MDTHTSATTTPMTTGNDRAGQTLTTAERLQASQLAAGIATMMGALKPPLRRTVLDQVAWLLGDP